MTECIVTVCQPSNHQAAPQELQNANFISDTSSVLQYIGTAAKQNTLIVVLSDEKVSRMSTAKMFYSTFVETVERPAGSYVQYRIAFLDEEGGDVINYRCERQGEIDSAIEQEGGVHRCCSVHATTVVPNDTAFQFIDRHFAVMMWDEMQYGPNIAATLQNTAKVLGVQFNTVCIYFADYSGGSSGIPACAKMVADLKVHCKTNSVGKAVRISSASRLEDVREWANSVVVDQRFAPIEPGPLLINLNPQPAVGERLAHPIVEGRSLIAADRANSSSVDIVVFAVNVINEDKGYSSVYSPHCCITYEDGIVLLRPECGMTYVNGSLLSEEVELKHNDRIVIGKEAAFRFVIATAQQVLHPSSRIIDWELCSKEFVGATTNAALAATADNYLADIRILRQNCEKLERQIQLERKSDDGHMWLVLLSPPEGYTGAVIWSLDSMSTGDSVDVGPNGHVNLGFLTTSVSLFRTADGFTLKAANTSKKLAHATRFVVENFLFLISMGTPTQVAAAPGNAAKDFLAIEGTDQIRQLRSSLFELQWSTSLLFDFAFPLQTNVPVRSAMDCHKQRRGDLHSDRILTTNTFKVDTLIRLTKTLTESLRMVGAGLSMEFNEGQFRANMSRLVVQDNKGVSDMGGGELRPGSTPWHLHQLGSALGSQLIALEEKLAGMESRQLPQVRRAASLAETSTSLGSQGAGSGILASGPRTGQDGTNSEVAECLHKLLVECTIYSTPVARHMGATVENLAISSNPKALWIRYMKTLDNTISLTREGTSVTASRKSSALFAVMDVLLAYNFGIRDGWITEDNYTLIHGKLESCKNIIQSSLDAFKKRVPPARGEWSHDAAIQRNPTPNLRKVNTVNRTSSRPPSARQTSGNSGAVSKKSSNSSTHNATLDTHTLRPTKKSDARPQSGSLGSQRTPSSNSLMKTCPPGFFTPSRDRKEKSVRAGSGTVSPSTITGKSVTRRTAPGTLASTVVTRRSGSSTANTDTVPSSLRTVKIPPGKANLSKTFTGTSS